MRKREKIRIYRLFMAGESVHNIWMEFWRKETSGNKTRQRDVEYAIRDVINGGLDKPKKK